MSCYHPLYGRYDGLNGSGKPIYKVCPYEYYHGREFKKHPRDILVPCGHCIGCRLDKSAEWADRCMLELDHSKKAVFVTLTFSDDSLLFNSSGLMTLDKELHRAFVKRLRDRIGYDSPIRFFSSGEYGSKSFRPHSHFIIFGLDLDDLSRLGDLRSCPSRDPSMPYYESSFISELWPYGMNRCAHVSWNTCAYVARYTAKKSSTDLTIFDELDVQRPFLLMSRRPGIGGYFAVDHPDLLDKKFQYITGDMFSCSEPKSKVRTPKYLFEKLAIVNPELYERVKDERRFTAEGTLEASLLNTDKSIDEYGYVREVNKNAALRSLSRDL